MAAPPGRVPGLMGAEMALPMAAMMVPTAAPFFLAYGLDSRRPAAIATVVLIYAAVWASIGLALGYPMSRLMMMSPSLPTLVVTVAIALAYAATPWARWARGRCRQMSMRVRRGPRFRDAVAEGASYAACCVVCSAGVMLAVIVVGMSNPLALVAGGAVMFAYKLVPGARRPEGEVRPPSRAPVVRR